MGVTVTCDGCGKDDPDDVYCMTCTGRGESDVREDDIIDLAAALRRGDVTAAEQALDRIVAASDSWRDAVDRGRYSRAARVA